MSGMDKTRFVNLTKTEEEDLSCGICLGIFVDPMVTQCCRQTYCGFCIKQWLKQYNTCPNDRNVLNESDLMPAPRVILNMLNRLQITCDFRDKGCEDTFLVENLEHHNKICFYNPENQCAVCDAKYGDILEHDCCANLLKKIKNLEETNQKMSQQFESLESNYNLINEENIYMAEESQTQSQEIERLRKFIKNIKQQISTFEYNIVEDLAIVSPNSSLSQSNSSIFRLKIGRFSTHFTKQYGMITIVCDMPWRILCQIDKLQNKFGFYLSCAEKNRTNWSLMVSASLRVVSQKESVNSMVRRIRQTFSNANPEHGFINFVPLSNILNPLNGYIKNDFIILEIVFWKL